MSDSFKSEVLGQLQESNSDTGKPHKFDFYLYFPTESNAKQAADQLRKDSYVVNVNESADGVGWLCKATKTLAPETAPLDKIHDFIQQIVADLEGDFDGWESDIVKRPN
jgi:hypothetical protein